MENKNLVMDYYQLTMAYSYFKQNKQNEIAYFDMFYRKNPDNGGYVISAGLDEVIYYIKNFRFTEEDNECLRKKGDFDEEFLNYLRNLRFTGDVYAIPDGTVVFPNEPLITIKANIIEAQLIETALLLHKNFASLITTKATKIVAAAKGRGVMEFGTRRAHEVDAAVKGAKYAYIGGAIGTACVEAEKEYGIPALGTMAHSYIESFDSEYEAFLNYAMTFPNKSVFLVDTYDTLKSGVPNAIKAFNQVLVPQGKRPLGIRLDSGDIAYQSKKARKMLDESGLEDCKIVASNSLDEYLIKTLIEQGACIDTFGVGENLITAKSDPVIGGVYKLVAIEKENEIIPKIKLSNNIGKITNPGYKRVYRFYDNETGFAVGDVIALYNEEIPLNEYVLINPLEEWKTKKITNYQVRELQVPIFKNGKLVYQVPTIKEVRENCQKELNTIYPEVKRFSNPHEYYVDLSKELLELKKQLLVKYRDQVVENEKGKQKVLGVR